VVIPTDNLDNPLPQNTKVTIQQQFLSEEKKEEIVTNNLIAHKNFYSPLKSGRILLSSTSSKLNSKEYTVNIMPSIGNDFKIFTNRNHNYADGNQITTFSTSVIKDSHNNIISDGSFVEFFIKTKKENILKTSGKTINGVAFAKILHPEFEDEWSVKAYIHGISESNEIKLTFKQVIKDFKVLFSKNNRQIKVGPLQSFMNQMIPDGLKVTLSIFKNGKLENSIEKKSIDGFVNFKLDPNIYPKQTYTIKIYAAGINKSFNAKKLW
jgi:S-adenosylmethionine synthetase